MPVAITGPKGPLHARHHSPYTTPCILLGWDHHGDPQGVYVDQSIYVRCMYYRVSIYGITNRLGGGGAASSAASSSRIIMLYARVADLPGRVIVTVEQYEVRF